MKKLFSWLFAALLFASVGALLAITYLEMHPEKIAAEKQAATDESKEKGEKKQEDAVNSTRPSSQPESQPAGKGEKGKEPPEVRTLENGDVVVTMDEQSQQRVGITTRKLKPFKRRPEVVAYGMLMEDPAQTFVLKAPIAGFLNAGKEPWPELGLDLKAGTRVGSISPRLSPSERADLTQRLAGAQAEVDEAQAALTAANEVHARLKALYAQQLTSEKALQEAVAAVRTNEAKLKGATRAVDVLRSTVTATTGPAGEVPLSVQQDGEVIQTPVRPGEAVESGQSLLQLVNYTRLLVRIEVPIGQTADPRVKTARIVVAGHESQPLSAKKIGPLPGIESRFGGQVLLFRVQSSDVPIQPGMAVTAFLEMPGELKTGVLIPRSALVRYAGRTWVYVRSSDEEFLRQSATVDHPEPGAVFVTKGVESGDSIVVEGAQSLLSKELTFSASEGGD